LATNAVDQLNSAMFKTWTIILLGLTPLALGVLGLRTHRLARGINAMALSGGSLCLIVGCVNLARQDQSTMEIPTRRLLARDSMAVRRRNQHASRSAPGIHTLRAVRPDSADLD
jgi:hypothetical protein